MLCRIDSLNSSVCCVTRAIRLPQIFDRDIAQRHAVDQHVALLRVVEAAEQVDERALAAAVGADDRQVLAAS